MSELDELSPLGPRSKQQQVFDQGSKTTEESNYTEGTDSVPLPSKGVFYRNEYKNLEELRVRPLNYSDEDILSTPSFFEKGTVFNELLNNTIVDSNGFKSKDLVAVDRDMILIWLRSNSFGTDYQVEFKCPKCGFGKGDGKSLGSISWDLKKIEMPEFDPTVYDELKEFGYVTITTPLRNQKVRITVPPIGEVTSLEKKYKNLKEKNRILKDFTATTTLLSIIQAVESENDVWIYAKDKIDEHFKKIGLPLSDSRYILMQTKEIGLKFDTAQDFICKDCGHVEEGVEMPILHKNFFWPES